MSNRHLPRRMFLRGAGGAALAIPFLPSLTKRAFASDPVCATVGPRFFAIRTTHGGVWHSNVYPDQSWLTESVEYAQRAVRYGVLPYNPTEDGRIEWSPVCSASADKLTPTVASKFNLLRGIDIPWQSGHNTGVALGNFASSQGVNAGLRRAYSCPTIDQVMAHSPTFYCPVSLEEQVIRRSFHLGHSFSQYYQLAATKSGRLIPQTSTKNNQQLYNYLFNATSSLKGMDQLIVDRVKANYDFLKANPSLSQGDRHRLDQHIERMFEVERLVKLSTTLQDLPPQPNGNTDAWTYKGGFGIIPHNLGATEQYIKLMLDMVVMAFTTGVSRVGTWGQGLTLATQNISDWHGQVAHEGLSPGPAQVWATQYNQKTFEYVLVELASRLDDVVMEDGQTLLDHSLLMQTSENGQVSHHTHCNAVPLITAGGANGYFNTGYYVDFSDQTQQVQNAGSALKPGLEPEYAGLMYNQFLANCLMAMGVPKSDWGTFKEISILGPNISPNVDGYGHYQANGTKYEAAKAVMGEPLPVITMNS